jgi:glutamate--cysteine ligase
MLQSEGKPVGLQEWGLALLEQIRLTAELLDAQHGDDQHAQAVDAQQEKLRDPALTPSARVLSVLQSGDKSFEQFGLQQSLAHAEHFRERPLDAQEMTYFENLAQQSLAEQKKMEHAQNDDFDAFVAAYNLRTPQRLCDGI